jgi:Family of unknown function (DUF5681)
MSSRPSERKRSAMGSEREYAVGKGRPPQHTRFQKGQSGNPTGRRRGSKNVATLLEQVLSERVIVTENGKRKAITKLEAMLKQLANQAASGDHRAIKLLIPLADTCLASRGAEASDAPAAAPLPSAEERRARARETMKILKEIGYFDAAVDGTSETQGERPESDANARNGGQQDDV